MQALEPERLKCTLIQPSICPTTADDLHIHPNQDRPAMEACGVDGFGTARANGFPLEVVRDSSCDHNYYGVVLVD